MAKPVARIVALQAALGLGLLLVVGRAGYLQLVKGGEYRRQASRQRTEQVELPARRGTIYDRNGTPLAVSQPKYHVTLALNEVRDTALLISRASARLRSVPTPCGVPSGGEPRVTRISTARSARRRSVRCAA